MPDATPIARTARVPKIAAYPELLRRVRKTFLAAQTKIREVKVRAAWEAGRDIHNHCLHHQDRAGYREKIINRLAGDLGVGDDVLYLSLRIYKSSPISVTSRKLTLSHYNELLKLRDPKQRLLLEEKIESENWNVRKLRTEIRKSKFPRVRPVRNGKTKSSLLLKPKKGKLGVYQIVADGEALAVDLGFTSYFALKPFVHLRGVTRFKEGDFVGFSPAGRMKKIKGASVRDLFTYEVGRWRVVDGDTVWFKIWHKRPLFLWEKLRLRGIDTPELSTAKGRRAKRFLETFFKSAVRIVITTTKPDKWDRYLSDLFVTTPDGREIFVNNLLLARGLARRYDDVSPEDWEQ